MHASKFNGQNKWLAIPEDALVNGAISRFGGKTFRSGLIGGAETQFLSDVVFSAEGRPEKLPSSNGPVNSAFKLLQPKTVKGHTSIPLDSIHGGLWANGASWEALY